ncbi:large ribosomal subunit protein mL39 isoform X2 [Pseudophryne corroboree]|uniref:large ribosomal subunit protein mL39 isoform X2 n=1 Tax=Pseudophryne corroboree TaxID=495146 RepID=UPI003081E2F2
MWSVPRMAGSCALRAGRGSLYSVATAAKLSNAENSRRRSELYEKEKERQLSLYPRIEKIEVKYVGKTNPETVFVMNKGLSTPYNCAMHLSEWYCSKSVLALVDGEIWDMYRPLTKSCDIQFLTFTQEDPEEVNKAYWRSCAAMLGHVLEQAFKDDYMVNLVRAAEIPVISGAFCYDVVLDSRLDDWKPTKENLHSFTKDALRLIKKDLPFESLEVDEKVAREIFQHNPYKLIILEEKAAQHPQGKVTLHRSHLSWSGLLCSRGNIRLRSLRVPHLVTLWISPKDLTFPGPAFVFSMRSLLHTPCLSPLST